MKFEVEPLAALNYHFEVEDNFNFLIAVSLKQTIDTIVAIYCKFILAMHVILFHAPKQQLWTVLPLQLTC